MCTMRQHAGNIHSFSISKWGQNQMCPGGWESSCKWLRYYHWNRMPWVSVSPKDLIATLSFMSRLFSPIQVVASILHSLLFLVTFPMRILYRAMLPSDNVKTNHLLKERDRLNTLTLSGQSLLSTQGSLLEPTAVVPGLVKLRDRPARSAPDQLTRLVTL